MFILTIRTIGFLSSWLRVPNRYAALVLVCSVLVIPGLLSQSPVFPDSCLWHNPRVAHFLSRYVAVPSVTGDEIPAGSLFAEECRARGLHVRVLTSDSAQYNFVASLYPLDSNKPNIVLLNHIDVVEPGDPALWRYPPFSGAIEEGAVWGRGAIDNKAMGAMQLEALTEWVRTAGEIDLPFNVTLLAVSGEEVGGGNGAAIVAERFLSLLNPVLVLGEGGTGMSGIFRSDPAKVLYGISINHKRLLWLRLKLNLSSAGHGSVPSRETANNLMITALGRLNERPNRLHLSTAARIMFSELGQHETGMTGIALRNLGFLKPLAGSALRKEPIIQALVTNTVSLTQISNPPGSNNQVPQEVEVILDCRLLPETETSDFIRELAQVLNDNRITIEILRETVRAQDSRPEAFYNILEASIRQQHPGAEVAPILFPATNDNNYFRSRGISTYGILPVFLDNRLLESIHNFNERIPIVELERGVSVYREFLRRVFEPILSPRGLTQTVRGRVLDKYLDLPLSNSVVLLSNDTTVVSAAQTNFLGDFRMDHVPLGRYKMRVFHEEYQDITILNVIVHAGKETIISIGLDESTDRVKLHPLVRRMSPLNEMATVSPRSFDVEETSRYPGTRDDPARMVANFAGVRGVDDSRNDIIIRGNAPFGLGWRLEDVDIPNPNHFAIIGTSGGGANIINSNVLARSDFYTGAFPAEFGNAVAGVFDLQMRTGNNEHHEFKGEIGTIATEASFEGPISRQGGSSYLASFRKSSIGLIDRLGGAGAIHYARRFGVDAVPHFQDAAFKMQFPRSNGDQLSVFGVGGTSRIRFMESMRRPCSFSYRDYGQNVDFGSSMGVVGLHYIRNLSTSSYLKASIHLSHQGMDSDRVRVYRDELTNEVSGFRPLYHHHSSIQDMGWAVRYGRKLSARNTFKAGFQYSQYLIDIRDTLQQRPVTNASTATGLIRSFFQWKHAFSNTVSMVGGMNAMYFLFNQSWSADPRMAMTWQLTPRRSVSAGIGVHSQLQPLYLYFQEKENDLGQRSRINPLMGFSRNLHFTLSYQNVITENLSVRTEFYFQNLTKIPVELELSSWSMLNQGLDFKLAFPGRLVNKGTGQNYGVEFTLERTFNKGYYFLLNLSLYDSKYTGGDGVRRDTDYNGRYIFNALGGREYQFNQRHTIGLSLRSTLAGGRRFTPIDLEASRQAEETILIDSLAYSGRHPGYFRTDFKIIWRYNRMTTAHEFRLDFQNIVPVRLGEVTDIFLEGCHHFPLSTRNLLTTAYDPVSREIRSEYQLEFLPIFSYRINF